ncbi:AzlD domain-containing protein [Haloquadratum walsbyi]|jgi:branched-subunit amino acid transport protein|uniref:ABC-type transport system accessory transmembrane protein n=2 Tax=Haloquadratum walsbyi TaxID=293091 RepID=Q18FS5_HALWD|nr:AzlD domain-containing protein [Haloquadratum walsbyi]CAJ53180.1 ABC-type transport system accessory transmembrane protein [Haloquadratum walsbyi DSM 16790]CCC41353.1 ABC-type transport system accessory transmembrane protein [Haloquadratum walsbyi C23]
MPTEYTSLAVWIVILALGVATFTIRISFISLFGLLENVPDRVTRGLQFVPPAVFAALAAPAFIAPSGHIEFIGNEQLIAGITATAIAWYVDDVFATIIAGMLTLWILRFGI